MLQISIHDRKIRRGAGQNPLYAGRGKAAPANTLQATNPVILMPDFTDNGRCLVTGVVIHKNDFPGNTSQGFLKTCDQ